MASSISTGPLYLVRRQSMLDIDIGARRNRLHPGPRFRERVHYLVPAVRIDLRRLASGQRVWHFAADEQFDEIARVHRLLAAIGVNAGERDRPVWGDHGSSWCVVQTALQDQCAALSGGAGRRDTRHATRDTRHATRRCHSLHRTSCLLRVTSAQSHVFPLEFCLRPRRPV